MGQEKLIIKGKENNRNQSSKTDSAKLMLPSAFGQKTGSDTKSN